MILFHNETIPNLITIISTVINVIGLIIGFYGIYKQKFSALIISLGCTILNLITNIFLIICKTNINNPSCQIINIIVGVMYVILVVYSFRRRD